MDDPAESDPTSLPHRWQQRGTRRRSRDHPRGRRAGRTGGAIDPEPRRVYHLVVIGGGAAGLAAIATAIQLGARAALVESRQLDGNRLYSSAPSAGLNQATRSWIPSDNPGGFGRRRTTDSSEFTAAMARTRGLRADFAVYTNAARLCRQGVDVFFGDGRFVAADAVEVNNRRLRFRRALIATGSRPTTPPIPGLDEVGYLTPETVFDLSMLPPKLAILGDNAEACEMAQAFAALGSRVHLFAPDSRLLPNGDAVAAEAVTKVISRDGVQVVLDSRLVEIQARQGDSSGRASIISSDLPEVPVDEILVVGGRVPNVERLGLEAARIDYDLAGIETDLQFRTSTRHIYAAGNVLSPIGLEHAADDEARRAVRNALRPRFSTRKPVTLPSAAFTRPEVAWVGLDTEAARALGDKVETMTLPLRDDDQRNRDDKGFLCLHLQRRTGRILGGTLVADNAADMIAPLTLAVRRKMRLITLAETLVPYPAEGEVYRRAALQWERTHRRRPSRNLLELWLRLT